MKKINLIERLLSNSHEKQTPQRFGRYAAMLIMLLTIGVGQMWADQNINKAYLKASFNGDAVLWDGSSDEYVYNGSGHDTYDLGTLTGDFVITYVSWRAYANWGQNTDFYLYYNKDGNGSSFPSNIKQNWNTEGTSSPGDYYPKTTDLSHKVASVTDGSGNYDFEHYFYADFGGYGGGNRSWLSNGGSNYHFTYTINPPDISSFSVTEANHLSGSGTSEDPYILPYNGTLALTISGSQVHTDANSSAQYYNTSVSNDWSTTNTKSISSVTSSEEASVTVKMRYHNSTASLDGAESSATIYYKSEPAYTVTVNNDGHGTTSPSGAQSNKGQVSGITISATPSTYYEFVNWTITSGTGTFTGGGTTSTSASTTFFPTSAATIQANFRSTVTNSLTVSAGTHVNTVSGSQDPVTLGNKYAISATAFATGYEFLNWTATPAANGTFDNASSASTNVTVKNGSVVVTANAQETMHTVSITGGTGSSSVGIATKATVTAAAAAAGKKFDHWIISGTYTLQDATTTSSREIHFTATSDVTLTAVYADRDFVKVYFAKPSGWSNVYAYAWQASSKVGDTDPTNRNAAWHGVDISSNTETVNGTTYHYYQYYTDNNGEGDDKSAQNSWDKIVFNDNGSNKTSDLTIADGHFYHGADDADGTGSAYGWDWYLRGTWNSSGAWNYSKPFEISANTATVNVADLTTSTTQEFMVYRASTHQYFKYIGGYSEYNAAYAAEIGSPMTLKVIGGSNSGNNTFTSLADSYNFTLDITSTSNPVLTVAPNDMTEYNTTLSIDGHGSLDKATGTIQLKQYVPTSITATPDPGYRFKQWNVSGVSCSSTTSATATFTATAAGGTIEAEFTNEGFIYFDNTMSQWQGDIYVYFFDTSNWWYNNKNDGKGPGVVANQNKHYGKMTRIEGSQIYYYDYHAVNPATNAICFTNGDHHLSSGLYKTSAVWRTDFNSCMPCYIASSYASEWKNEGTTGYHNAGYWKRWGDTNSGFTLYYTAPGNSEQSIAFVTDDPTSSVYTAEVSLSSANANYSYNVARCSGAAKLRRADYEGSIQDSDSDYPRELGENASDGTLRTSAAGTYKFTLSLATDHIMMTVEYPLSVGDYRVRLHNGTKSHPSGRIIRARSEEKTDTVSFYIDKDKTNTLYVDSCTSTGNPPTWNNISDVLKATITLTGEPYKTKTGIYKFAIRRTKNKDVELKLLEEPAYDGDFYIRTDAADGKWTAYMTTDDNKMRYTPQSLTAQTPYDYYFTKWAASGKNMHFTIANDYSPCISDTLTGDATYLNGSHALPADANVRFGWNSKTNTLHRAFIHGSTANQRFLVLTGDAKTFNSDGTAIAANTGKGLEANELEFDDKGNWVYQLDIKAQSGSTVDVTAKYNNQEQTFISNQTLITSSDGDEKYHLRAVYDFKTDLLTTAWVPEGEVSGNLTVTADMMLIRHAQDPAQQLTFATNSSVSSIKKMIGAIEFRKDSIVGRVANFNGDVIGATGNRANRELMLYISFPFDVAVNDIYGCGTLGKEWYLQYYDGADRAAKGFFRGDGTTTFWKFMTLSDTLRAGQGYSLLLDNDYFNSDDADGDNVWHNIAARGSVYLYFPSVRELHEDSIISSGLKTLNVPSHECLHDRTFTSGGKTVNHKFTDSHWNMIGVPLFQNQTEMETGKFTTTNPSDDQLLKPLVADHGYFYEWDSLSNNFSVHSTTDYIFKSMHGYMVQFSGTIGFTGASIQPASSVAVRRTPLNREDYTLELQLLRNNNRISRTYVELREEACDTFALNEDVYMMYTSLPADLFTFAGNYDVSANVLSIDNHVVPVGVEVHQAGEYTFAMPDNFSGSAVLVDTEANTRTNLAISDYTVTLPKGVSDGRFFLELDINKMPTAIDGVTDGSGSLKDGKVHKFIQNGVMYILENGRIYDAQGRRLQ